MQGSRIPGYFQNILQVSLLVHSSLIVTLFTAEQLEGSHFVSAVKLLLNSLNIKIDIFFKIKSCYLVECIPFPIVASKLIKFGFILHSSGICHINWNPSNEITLETRTFWIPFYNTHHYLYNLNLWITFSTVVSILEIYRKFEKN